MHYVIGIDPGKKGAVAVVDISSRGRLAELRDTPLEKGKEYDPKGMMAILEAYSVPGQSIAIIEKQAGFRGDSHGASFTTGFGYGIWIALLELLEIPYIEVPPKGWQKKMGISGNCYGNTKKASLELAKANFPEGDFGKKDGRSDAALIAVYGAILHKKGCAA